jgi:colanic acid/amylovoran biosynthesis glycosyltransferase
MPNPASDDPLRLAIITMEFPSPSETFVSGRVKSLTDMGVAVEVFSLRPEESGAHEMAVARGITGVRRDSNSIGSALRGLFVALMRPVLTAAYLRWLFAATRAKPDTLVRSLALSPRAFDVFWQLSRRDVEVVHAEWGHYPALVLWLVQARLKHVATSIALNAYDLTMEYGGSVEVTRRADLIRTHTHANIAHIAAFTGVDPGRVELVYNGVDVGAFDSVIVGTEKVPGRVVTIARLIPEKRVDLVIHAFAACASDVLGAELRVFGDGPERARLEELVKQLGLTDSVVFFGHVDHERVMRELAQAEVLMLLSETVDERLPNVVKEGMAARCVCITSSSVGIEELVDHGATGFVVEYGDLAAATDALRWALAHREEARQMGAAARDDVGRKFDHQANVRRFLELWRTRARGEGRTAVRPE